MYWWDATIALPGLPLLAHEDGQLATGSRGALNAL